MAASFFFSPQRKYPVKQSGVPARSCPVRASQDRTGSRSPAGRDWLRTRIREMEHFLLPDCAPGLRLTKTGQWEERERNHECMHLKELFKIVFECMFGH
ncbi:hypothetical protein CDAR_111831 [Caerostris darwini]|uniref:Uncharacterized protein n=1 Tax=Caerostris darwini TaxID=1538125 RepID=A0AAV4Q277_9ARAC|nr:hypothetical protein CDAR_111831 [Caerostris darwini]